MKPKIIKLTAIFLLLLFIGAGCKKNEIEIADESIVVDNHPGVEVYKTNGNYFNYITVSINETGQISRQPDYTLNDPRIKMDKKGRVTYNSRWLLKSGYIVDMEAHHNDAYTNITFQEYVDYNTKNGVVMPSELILPRIIEKDPYIKFYHMGCLNCKLKEFTLGEINQMIENGTLEEHFEKIK